jgi:hypothetical protein
MPKPPQNNVDTGDHLKGPHASHHEEVQHEGGHQGVGRSVGLTEPPLAPLTISFHVVLPDWFLGPFRSGRGTIAPV